MSDLSIFDIALTHKKRYCQYMLTNDDLMAIQKLIREEVQGTEKRLTAKIDKVQETVDVVQNVVVKHYGKLDQRVTNLEEELHIPKN